MALVLILLAYAKIILEEDECQTTAKHGCLTRERNSTGLPCQWDQKIHASSFKVSKPGPSLISRRLSALAPACPSISS